MSKQKDLQDVANEIFKAHPQLNEIFITVDGQGFTDEEKAKDNARYHKDKTVKHFKKDSEDVQKDSQQSEDRKALMEEYETLFGEKAAHNIGLAKLQEKISVKKQELESEK